MKMRTWIIWLIGVGILGIGTAMVDRIARMPATDSSISNPFFLLEAILICVFILGGGYILWIGIKSDLKPKWPVWVIIIGIVCIGIFIGDQYIRHQGLSPLKLILFNLGKFLIVILIVVSIVLSIWGTIYKFWPVTLVKNRKMFRIFLSILAFGGLIYLLSQSSETFPFTVALAVFVPILTLHIINFILEEAPIGVANFLVRGDTESLFYGVEVWFILYQPGKEPPSWRGCIVEVLPSYVKIATLGKQFVFNPENVRWLSRVERHTSSDSNLWFDLEIDGLWYVLRLSMNSGLMDAFMKQMAKILPDDLHYRRPKNSPPNLRHGPAIAHPAIHTADDIWLLAESLQLYLTPLYLVLLNETFVQQAIPLAEVKGLEVLAAANLPDQQIVRFGQGDKTLAFAVQDQDFVHTLKARL